MKVYTYHAPCPEIDPWYKGDQLLELWRDEWTAAGFETVVLQESHAREHPLFEVFARAIEKFPTTNPIAYERACWYRWLALSHVGGGLMSDADVLPVHSVKVRFTYSEPAAIYSIDYKELGLCPCLFSGSTDALNWNIRTMMEAANNPHFKGHRGRHYSDQSFVRDFSHHFTVHNICRTFGDPRSVEAKLIHYKTDAIGAARDGRTKPQIIRSLR